MTRSARGLAVRPFNPKETPLHTPTGSTATLYEQKFPPRHARDALLSAMTARARLNEVIDLYADGFDPVLSRDELAVYNAGMALDPLVPRYQELISRCNRLVFIFPIWRNDVPAMLRGWLDKGSSRAFAEVTLGGGSGA